MELEKIGIITFLGKENGVRYVGLFSDSDKRLQAVNYHTGRFVDYVCYRNEPLYEANEEQRQFLFNALAKENKYYCEKTKTIKEMKKEKGTKCTDWADSGSFTKKDLKSGMWAKTRNGNTYIIIENMTTQLYGTQKFCLIGDGRFVVSDSINDDLTYKGNKEFDIIGLYGNILGFGDKLTFSFDKQTLIWERETEEDKQIKEMQSKLDEMKKAYNELEKNISETIEKLNKLKK